MSGGLCYSFEHGIIGSDIGYNISSLQVFIAVVASLSVLFIFVALFRALAIQEEHFTLYLGFALLSAFTLMLATVQRLLPAPLPPMDPSKRTYAIGLNVMLAFLISLQWFIQTGAVFFLLVRNPGSQSLRRRVLLPAFLMMVALLAPWIITLVLDSEFVGQLLDESILILFFFSALLLTNPSFRRCARLQDFFLHPRPMMRVWGFFMLGAHVGFFIMYLVRGIMPGSEAGSCLYVVVDSCYYLAYAPVFMFVVRRDSRYWSEHGSLLLDMHLAMEHSEKISSGGKDIAGIPLIKFSHLNFREKIGSGGYSEVYRAKWDGSTVAVKVFRVAQGQLETMNELLREARIMYRLQHPNILQLLGLAMRGRRTKSWKRDPVSGNLEETPLLVNDDAADLDSNGMVDDAMVDLSDHDVILCSVLKFCSGGTLFDRLHQKVDLDIKWRLSILHDVAKGMAYLHEQGVIHRDLKSPNVLITEEAEAVIADFGMSKDAVGTITMSAIGTPHWMAPEILRGDRYSNSADVWAFGVIIFEVASRQLPYVGISPIVIMQRVAHENLRLSLPPNSCDESVRSLMADCLAEIPADRPSFDQIEMRLERMIDSAK